MVYKNITCQGISLTAGLGVVGGKNAPLHNTQLMVWKLSLTPTTNWWSDFPLHCQTKPIN